MQVNFILHIFWGSLFPVQKFSAQLIIINLSQITINLNQTSNVIVMDMMYASFCICNV